VVVLLMTVLDRRLARSDKQSAEQSPKS
jgi:hypothetical protein